ncbi:MAG: YbaK/EbsC family protein [Bacillota bacterium]|nr:YbaK/EbsC family protein [Bacillota bacterium]
MEKVRKYFAGFGLEDRIKTFDQSSATVDLAAQALGVQPCRIAKTLSFILGDQAILVVTAGDGKIDNQKFKTQFGRRAKMIKADQVEDLVGFKVGGVCPFGVKEGVKVYLDQSLKRFDTVFPAAGSSSSAIELSLEELEKYSNYEDWVDVCKAWQES